MAAVSGPGPPPPPLPRWLWSQCCRLCTALLKPARPDSPPALDASWNSIDVKCKSDNVMLELYMMYHKPIGQGNPKLLNNLCANITVKLVGNFYVEEGVSTKMLA